jgi:hypothetical protein
MSRTKKKSSPPPTPTSKKRKSATPTPPSNSQQQELWYRCRDGLSPEVRETVENETRAARAAGGSRLAAALHLLVVHDALCGDATNPKQKKLWSAYLAVNLPGFYISRSQVFIDIKAAKVAREFPAAFLNEFLTSGYAINVRPTTREPLGKFTEPCKQILAKLKPEELSGKECQTVLAEAAAIVKAEAKKNRASKTVLTAEEKRERLVAELHNTTIGYFEDLATEANESGDSYVAMHVRDDLEEFVCRLMTAMDVDALELRQMSLPEGFHRLKLSSSAVDSSDDETSESALAATAA